MKITGLLSIITLLVFTNVFSQQSNAPAKPAVTTPLPQAAGVAATTPVKTTPQVSSQTSLPTSSKPMPGALNPFARKAIAQAKANIAQRKACDSLYGKEISARTGDLQKKMIDLMQKERSTTNAKRGNNTNFLKMKEIAKQLHVKDSLAYADTSANRLQRRKEAQNARFEAMKKMRLEERNTDNDPELVKIRQSIATLQKQINDTIAIIVKNDSKCASCYNVR